MKRTKIIATIGPASNNEKTLRDLINAGVDVVRLNFSHGNFEQKKETIQLVRRLSQKMKKQIAILADLPGPKIRLGEIEGIFNIKKGETITFGFEKPAILPIQYDFTKEVKKGQKMYLNDGLVELEILSSKNQIVTAKAKNSGWVSSRKGINLPETFLKGAAFTKEDQEAASFVLNEGVEFIALSFVQTAEDVNNLRKLITKNNKSTKIIAKIEKPEAFKNIEEIISAADGVMVARGDLAIETSPSQVPLIQKRIIALARQHQKPVIVATQMLESMIENPRPTRAEASDVANAVLSQVDAVMLSAESASGKYPVEAVSMMSEIISTVENDPEFKHYIKINWEKLNLNDIHFNAIVSSAASLAFRLKAPVIGVGTATGKTTRQISSFRPSSLIIAITHDEVVARQLTLNWGVYSIVVPSDNKNQSFGQTMHNALKKNKLIKQGSVLVLVWGSKTGVSGTTDTIRAIKV